MLAAGNSQAELVCIAKICCFLWKSRFCLFSPQNEKVDKQKKFEWINILSLICHWVAKLMLWVWLDEMTNYMLSVQLFWIPAASDLWTSDNISVMLAMCCLLMTQWCHSVETPELHHMALPAASQLVWLLHILLSSLWVSCRLLSLLCSGFDIKSGKISLEYRLFSDERCIGQLA